MDCHLSRKETELSVPCVGPGTNCPPHGFQRMSCDPQNTNAEDRYLQLCHPPRLLSCTPEGLPPSQLAPSCIFHPSGRDLTRSKAFPPHPRPGDPHPVTSFQLTGPYMRLSIILQRFRVLSVSCAQPRFRTISKMARINRPADWGKMKHSPCQVRTVPRPNNAATRHRV